MLPRRPGTGRSRGVVLLCAVLLCGGTACGGEPDIRIETTRLSRAEAATCEAVVRDVPDSLGGRDRRPVSPATAYGAAWGSPAIVMTCGVEVPELPPTAVCEEADGVGWFVTDEALEDESADVVMTTAGYRPVVEVVVPAGQRPEGVAAAMAGLADPVSAHTELVRPCV